MKWLSVAFWLASVLPVFAAETVKVRSGEHDGFSRLVFYADGSPEWILDGQGNQRRLVISGYEAFDFSDVFVYIPRDRVAAIESADGGVKIDLGCDCRVSAFREPGGYLVVDIADNNIPAPSTTLPFLPALQPYTSLPLPPLPDPSREMPSLEAFRNALVSEFGRAASQGLVVVDVEQPETDSKEEQVVAIPKPKLVDHSKAPPAPGVSVRTAIDRDRPVHAKDAETALGLDCISDPFMSLGENFRSTDPVFHLSQTRSGLSNELDQLTEESVSDLAQAYLELGFGAEARQFAKLGVLNAQRSELLDAIGRIVDLETGGEKTALDQYISCKTEASFWAALATENLNDQSFIAVDAILQTFSALPSHLRRQLGPELADRFLKIGDRETARQIENAILRTKGDQGAAVALLGAHLNLSEGDIVSAEETLSSVVDSNDPLAIDALLEVAGNRIAHGFAPLPQHLQDARSLAFQYRGTEQGTALERVVILGLGFSGEFDDAFIAVKEYQAAKPIREEYVALVTNDAEDSVFLAQLFLPDPLMTDVKTELRRKVARRFLDLGFPDIANSYLPDAQQFETCESRLLAARILVAVGDVDGAIARLDGSNCDGAPEILRHEHLVLGVEDDAFQAGPEGRLNTSLTNKNRGPQGESDPLNLQSASENLLHDQGAAKAIGPALALSEQASQSVRNLKKILQDLPR